MSRHGRRRFRIAAAALLMAAAVVTACESNDQNGNVKIGARRDGSRPSLLVYSCEGDPVQRVVVHESTDDYAADGEVIWAIERRGEAAGSDPLLVVLGDTPPGWAEVTAYTGTEVEDLLARATYRSGRTEFLRFDLGNLRPDEIKVEPSWYRGKRFVSPDRFESKNERACAEGF